MTEKDKNNFNFVNNFPITIYKQKLFKKVIIL